jgi:formate-dependent nitrite reductase cytochrome c552 subunit
MLLAHVALAGDHAYVGESKCEDCHDSGHEALNITGPNGAKTDPVTVWNADPHSKAFNNLTNAWGKQAATKAGVSDPQADGSMCLHCHATGVGGNNPPDPSEGVSCEACHGPAADWIAKEKHGEIDDSAAKMQAAVALGLIDVRKMDIRESNCRNCHVKDVSQRPCYRSSEAPFNVNNDNKFKHWVDPVNPL